MTFAGGFAVSRGGGVLADRALKLSHGALVASEEREGCAALGVSHERVVRDGVHLVVAEPVIAVMVGWPGASQPPAPTDPDVTVSRHPALLTSVSDWLYPLPLGE